MGYHFGPIYFHSLYNVKTRTMTVAIYTEVLRGNYGWQQYLLSSTYLDSYFLVTIYENF